MTPFTVIDAEQRSPEWKLARCGRVTGSRAADVLAKIKSGEAAARRDYRLQIVCERLTGEPQDDPYQNSDTRRGVELEPEACAAFEAATGELVQATGFLAHNQLLIGCSLDGHLGEFDSIVELKVPRSAAHLRYWRTGGIPSEHVAQLRHNLLVTGAMEAIFASWDPRFPPKLQLFIARLKREDADLISYEKEVCAFLQEVENEVRAVQTMADLQGTLQAAVTGQAVA